MNVAIKDLKEKLVLNKYMQLFVMSNINIMDEDEDSTNLKDDDPVTKEIPIFLSQRLQENLYMFQYPLLPKYFKDESNIKKAFLKPENQQVHLELELNVESHNFDSNKAVNIAHEIDGNKDHVDKGKIFENGIMDKVILSSSKIVKDPRKYAVGCYNGKELHLTSLKGFLQLRPSLKHLDRSLKRKRETQSNYSSDEEEEAGSLKQQVRVKFGKSDEKKTHDTFKTMGDKIAAEPWTECIWHKSKSILSEIQKQKLIAEVTDDIGQAMNITPSEYIRVIVPEDQELACVVPSLPSHVMSLHSLRALPLLEQCRILLKDAKIIQFQQLLMLLAGGEGLTSETLLRSLPQVAVLVRGNWVVKSEVLYPNNTFSAVSGVPAELMCRARDYILFLFTKNQYVDRRKVSSVIRIPAEEIKEIFVGISKLKHSKGWELSLSTDSEFISKQTDIVQRQNVLWEQRSRQLTDLFKDCKEKPKQRRKSKSVCEDGKSKSDDTKSKSGGRNKKDSLSSDTDSGTEKNKSPLTARKNKNIKLNGEVNIKSEPT